MEWWPHGKIPPRNISNLWKEIEEKILTGYGVGYIFNLSIGSAEAAGLWFWGQPGLESDLQERQRYIEQTCLKNQTKQTNCQIKDNK